VSLGDTRVQAVVAAAIDAPHSDRPNEGTLRFDVELSPMASPAFEHGGRPGPDAVELARLVERALRGSRAVDQEALCVLPGRRVSGEEGGAFGDGAGGLVAGGFVQCACTALCAAVGATSV